MQKLRIMAVIARSAVPQSGTSLRQRLVLCPWDFDTGTDNAECGLLENHVEHGNDFGMGTYHMSDFSCKNCTIIGNLAGIYWKTFRRGKDTPPVMDGGRLAHATLEGFCRSILEAPPSDPRPR